MLLPYADGYGVPNEMTAPRDSRASALLLLLLATRPAASSLSESSSSAVRFANVFGDDMVLQAGSPAPVWGWAAPSAAAARGHHNLRNSAGTPLVRRAGTGPKTFAPMRKKIDLLALFQSR